MSEEAAAINLEDYDIDASFVDDYSVEEAIISDEYDGLRYEHGYSVADQWAEEKRDAIHEWMRRRDRKAITDHLRTRRQPMTTRTLYPTAIRLLDNHRDTVKTILAYEADRRVNTANLPEGWHRYAVRANDGNGANDTFENWVWVDHMNDYISREDVSGMLAEQGGMVFEYAETDPDEPPIDMPDSIYQR